ncbi:hypothetical protein SAMN02799633_01174 [Bacillus sp. UNCCL81]|nr:hypothetical protein SAMN02799633_01174 [Bacillus sp. UNCCL81]
MSLLKRYGKWLFKFDNRRNDLAEFILEIIFLPSLFWGTKFLLKNYSFIIALLVVFLSINLYSLLDGLLRKNLNEFNVNIPKWISIIPTTLIIAYIIFIDK